MIRKKRVIRPGNKIYFGRKFAEVLPGIITS